MLKKIYETKFYETDFKNRIKDSVLLNFMQDIAADDAEKMGFGYSKIKDKNIGWFLTKYHIKLFDTLNNNGQISIETESKGYTKISCIRDFDIYNMENIKIGEATSSWILSDFNTGKIVAPYSIFNNIPMAEKSLLRSNFPKISQLTEYSSTKDFFAQYSDIDVNQHVNNAVYLTWANDSIPINILNETHISELEIQYKQQVKYGEKVIVYTNIDYENLIFTQEIKLETGITACLIRQKRIY
ncbi:hypothetical protein IJG14_04790 [bacterium]|nr:hypothetical protein [bacterium]